jgi:hypothetical protein
MSSDSNDTTDDSTDTDSFGSLDSDSEPPIEHADDPNDASEDFDPDNPEDVWADIDPVAEGKTSGEFEKKYLPDDRPVRAKEVTQGDLEQYRDRVEARYRNVSDKEIAERTIMLALKEHYDEPSFDHLTLEEYKDGKLGHYNKFVELIFGDVENTQGNARR